jgi:hypothetical protein
VCRFLQESSTHSVESRLSSQRKMKVRQFEGHPCLHLCSRFQIHFQFLDFSSCSTHCPIEETAPYPGICHTQPHRGRLLPVFLIPHFSFLRLPCLLHLAVASYSGAAFPQSTAVGNSTASRSVRSNHCRHLSLCNEVPVLPACLLDLLEPRSWGR